MFVASVEGANQREKVGTQIRKGVADEARSLKWCWELDDGAKDIILHGTGGGRDSFSNEGRIIYKRAEIEVLLLNPL